MEEKITGGRAKGDLQVEGATTIGELRVAYEVTFPGGRPDLLTYPGQGEEGLGGMTVAGDLAIPRSFKATVADPPGPRRKRVTLAFEADPILGVGVTQLAIEVEQDEAMREEDVRTLKLGAYIDAAKAAVTREADPEGGRWREPLGGLVALGPWWGRNRPGRRPVSDEVLQQVAKLYDEAKTLGVPTAAHVSAGLDDKPSISATRRRIMLARQRGFLPPVVSNGEEG